MKRVGSLILTILLASSLCLSQSDASASKAVGHGAFPVKLTRALDSSKLKAGDAVEVETAGSFKLADGTLVSRGSKLLGHVVMAQARSKGDARSELTVIFDKLKTANGKQLALKGVVQAVFPALEEQAPQMAGKASGAAGGGYAPSHNGAGTASGTMGTVTDAKTGSSMSVESKHDEVPDPKSTGVHRVHDLELGRDGELFSGGKQVKLGAGERLIIHVDILE